MDLLERLLRVLSTDREPRIIQPSPVHVNVTVPSNQGSPIINVPPSPQHQVTVTDGSPKLEVGGWCGVCLSLLDVSLRYTPVL